MQERFVDTLYQTVIGELQTDFMLKGVEDSFAPGGLCDQAYTEMRKAYDRVLRRLGVDNEDSDLEIMITCMRIIQKEIAYQMYRYGVHFGIEDQL